MDQETAFWAAAMAAEYLRSLFAAAMLAGLDARVVAGWIPAARSPSQGASSALTAWMRMPASWPGSATCRS